METKIGEEVATTEVAMAKPETTEWFGPDTLPGQEGVFEIEPVPLMNPRFSYWDCTRWSITASSPQTAYKMRNMRLSAGNSRTWRGLAQQP